MKMESFCLLTGHLVGDYIFQNDWQATHKTSSSLVCAIHCLLYGLAVWLLNFWWLPLWCVAAAAVLHFPVDRWRMARKWMAVVGQEQFATGPFSPWSIIVVDNVIHVIVLAVLGLSAAS